MKKTLASLGLVLSLTACTMPVAGDPEPAPAPKPKVETKASPAETPPPLTGGVMEERGDTLLILPNGEGGPTTVAKPPGEMWCAAGTLYPDCLKDPSG